MDALNRRPYKSFKKSFTDCLSDCDSRHCGCYWRNALDPDYNFDQSASIQYFPLPDASANASYADGSNSSHECGYCDHC